MAKVKCYNCIKVTPVIAPNYRCKFCNYPLNKYVESKDEPQEEVIIEKIKQDTPGDLTINDIYRNVPEPQKNIDKIKAKLKPDETIQKKVNNKVKSSVIIKKNKNPEKDGKIIAGWLVVHTEGKLPVTYELFEGKNVIGRPDGPHHVDIRIEDDEYVSRIHAVLQVTKDFLHRFRYELLDDGSLRGGSPSTNGIYINGITDRLPRNKTVYLRDSDTVQIGMTKLVFKNTDEADDLHAAANSVMDSDFTNTVAIRRK